MRPGIRSMLVMASVVVAGIAVATAPSIERVVGPFELAGEVGDTVDARLFSARVTDVGLATELDLSYGQDGFGFSAPSVASDQVFVVIDVTVTSEIDRVQVIYSELLIDGVTYRVASFLPNPTVLNSLAGPGLPVAGPLVFEVPMRAIDADNAANAQLHLKTQLTPQLESVPVFSIDLSGISVEQVRVLSPAAIPDDIR